MARKQCWPWSLQRKKLFSGEKEERFESLIKDLPEKEKRQRRNDKWSRIRGYIKGGKPEEECTHKWIPIDLPTEKCIKCGAIFTRCGLM